MANLCHLAYDITFCFFCDVTLGLLPGPLHYDITVAFHFLCDIMYHILCDITLHLLCDVAFGILCHCEPILLSVRFICDVTLPQTTEDR